MVVLHWNPPTYAFALFHYLSSSVALKNMSKIREHAVSFNFKSNLGRRTANTFTISSFPQDPRVWPPLNGNCGTADQLRTPRRASHQSQVGPASLSSPQSADWLKSPISWLHATQLWYKPKAREKRKQYYLSLWAWCQCLSADYTIMHCWHAN